MRSKMKPLLFLFMSLCTAAVLPAQTLRHRAVKCDLIAFSRNGAQVAYAFGQNQKSSFEIQVGFEQHKKPAGVEVFHGDWLNLYGEEKLDTLVQSTHVLVGSSGWGYLDEQRPLTEVPTYVPHSTLQLAGLYRISFLREQSPWKVFLQSGFFVTLHRYFENREALFVNHRLTESWDFVNNFGQDRKVKYDLIIYEEKRSIRLKNDWRAGVAYQLGVSRRFGKHFLAEGRLDLGLHIGAPPYETPEPPLIVRRLPVKPALMIGWAF